MNLLFLYTDEQAFNTLACYGNDWIQMPNLNRLADTSCVFEKTYVTQPVCTPSRSTLITGLWPHTNGCVRNNVPLQHDTRCLPEILPAGQYVTAHYGKWHLGDEIFKQHGFDEWINYEDMYSHYYLESRDKSERSQYHDYLIEQGYKPDMEEQNKFSRGFTCRLPEEHGKPSWIAGKAIDFIQRHADKPFVLYVNFLEPHMPFFGPRDEQYDPESIPLPVNHEAMPDNSMPEKYLAKSMQKTPEAYPNSNERSEADWRKLRARYYGLCSLVDTHAGRLLDAVKSKGLWDDTMIVFTSDHGDMMGSHGQTAKGVMYEEAVRVPMLIKMPGQNAMKHIHGPVSQIDMLPTILDMMGESIPDELQGRSLKPVMESPAPVMNSYVFIEWNSASPTGEAPKNTGEAAVERAIVTAEGWKFVWSSCGKHILFDLNNDPGETDNLFGRPEHAEFTQELYNRLLKWQSETCDTAELSQAL